jgi:hypothetical protein
VLQVHVAERGALERPSVQHRVIRDLAAGEMRDAAIARKYGVATSSLVEFKRRHSDRIAHVRGHLDDVFAGIEFADKANRVAELSQDAATIAEVLADPETAARAGVGYAEMVRAKQSALRAIAEELGQLPSRMQVQVAGSLDVQVNGVDVGALK